MKYELTEMESGRIRIIISNDQEEMGTLYFEKAKLNFTNKPISMGSWACVDAKIEKLFTGGEDDPQPKDIIKECQELIRQAGY